MKEKTTEMDQLSSKHKELLSQKQEMQERLQSEFNTKLHEYANKREEQYKQEKHEWMRIFKEEFNNKLRSYKDANGELSNSNEKLMEEIRDLKQRINKLKQHKNDLELNVRNCEEEYEKLRNDFDVYKSTKDCQEKEKNQLIITLKEQKKQRDIEYDEVVGIKIQLAQEIELYRRILSDAEQSAGYSSPLASNRNNKKRKLSDSVRATLGATIGGMAAGVCGSTPGIIRGAQLARQDLDRLETVSKDGTVTGTDTENESDIENKNRSNNISNNNRNKNKSKNNKSKNKTKSRKRNRKNLYNDMDYDGAAGAGGNGSGNGGGSNSGDSDGESKDGSECGADDEDNNDGNGNDGNGNGMFLDDDGNGDDSYITPGGEPWPLQFSTMDLTRSMIEIQNISDGQVSLRGYTLSNSDGSAQFPLPNDRVLEPNEKLKVMIGLRAKPDMHESSILWKADVWTGDEEDVARLYDPNSQEVARIEIHPDMLPIDKKNGGGCIVM